MIKTSGQNLATEYKSIREKCNHPPTFSQQTEDALINNLNGHLPKRFRATSGFLVDYKGNISKQTDVIIYDQENAFLFVDDKRNSVVPINNVAAYIEVKSNLNKSELADAAKKISSAKKLDIVKVSSNDQPVTFSPLIVTNSLGVVFAYQAKTSLKTLAKNLEEINKSYDSSEWIDKIVVLGVGTISYYFQPPGSHTAYPTFMASKDHIIPTGFMSLHITETKLYAYNLFLHRLMTVLPNFRKITHIPRGILLNNFDGKGTSICNYWYNSKRKLIPFLKEELDEKPIFAFRICDDLFFGTFYLFNWSDGYCFQVTPPLEENLKFIKEIIMMKSDENFSWVSDDNNIVYTTTLLKNKPVDLEVIIDFFKNRGLSLTLLYN